MLDDFVRSKAFPIKFLIEAGCVDICSVKPNEITKLELNSFMLGIVIVSLSILSLLNILNKAIVCFMKMKAEVGDGGSCMFSGDLKLRDKARMMAVVCEERRHFGPFLGGVIVCKFSQREQVDPVVLIIIAGDAEISFKGLIIQAFSLTVGLWMKSGRLARINLEYGGERGPEMRSKNRTAIGNN